MPSEPSGPAVQIQLKDISLCLDATTKTLDVISESMGTPVVHRISLTVQALLELTARIKEKRSECANLLEQAHEVLNGIIFLHLKAEELSPNDMGHIADFLGTLHKILVFMEEQQGAGRIKKLFRQSQINTLFKECKAGLKHAIDVFKIQTAESFRDVRAMTMLAERRHEEVLEFVANLSDTTHSDSLSWTGSRTATSFYNSSTSFSMLPSDPRILYGRESEIFNILELLAQPEPRVAILGPGGIGKTTLARAVLHHPNVALKYGTNRFFIPCEAASSKGELVSLIGLYLGLETGSSGKVVIQYMSNLPHGLIILDNLETAWEAFESRKEVEDFLSLIASSCSLALMVTMRGAERPAQVAWTRPFLQPLQPLSQDAAREMFLEISDEAHDSDDITELLALTDHVPLVIDLLAHLSASEGLSVVLKRWRNEKTSLMSLGFDQRSNLDMSIALSLSSPRLGNATGATDLLALLALLPDGVLDVDLLQSDISIPDILRCKAALLRTSLAYTNQKRLKVLAPIREYMQAHHPPNLDHTEALFHTYSRVLQNFFTAEQGVGLNSMMISMNFANMQSIILFRLQHMPTDLEPTIYAALHLNEFSKQQLNQSDIPLMAQMSPNLVQPRNPRLEVYWACDRIYTNIPITLDELQNTTAQTLEYFPHFNDSYVKSRFYRCVGERYLLMSDPAAAINWYRQALEMATSAGDSWGQARALERISCAEQRLGDYVAGLVHASEAQQFARISGSFAAEAQALCSRSICLHWLGRYSECFSGYQRARTLLDLSVTPSGLLNRNLISSYLAELHRIKSEYDQAREILISLRTAFENSATGKPWILMSLAELGVETGLPVQDVEDYINEAKPALTQPAAAPYLLSLASIPAALDLREGNMDVAKETFERCLRSEHGADNETRTYCLEKLGDTKLWNTQQPMLTWPTMLLAHALHSKQKLHIYKGFQFLGELALVEGDEQTAMSLLTVALVAFTHMDVHRSRGECMLQLGNIAHINRDYQKAEELWTTSRPLFERSSQEKKVSLVDEKLADLEKSWYRDEPAKLEADLEAKRVELGERKEGDNPATLTV